MERKDATNLLRQELNKYGLTDWAIRLNQNSQSHFLGLCSYKDKCIILSAHHIDIHPDPDVLNTIRHEIAHALTPGHGHDAIWAAKAKEIGCDNTLPCSNLSLSPEIIDAIRSGATVEVTFDEHVIRTPRYNITRLQDKCPQCGKVARTKSEFLVKTPDDKPDIKLITLECGHVTTRNIPKGTPFHKFQMGGLPDCPHEWNKNRCLACGRSRPYQFQIEGMAFLEAGLSVNQGAACFDDMGLGKTIQAGGVLFYHPEWLPALWAVPTSLKYQTASFIMSWMGTDHLPQVINTSKDWLIPGLKHYIVGYDMLVPKTRTNKNGKVINSGLDLTQLDRVGIKSVVLDECQKVKNVDSNRTHAIRRVVKGRKVIPLSGTPWNNRGSELFPVLNMIAPSKFPSEQGFKDTWVDYWYQGSYRKEGGIRNIKQFKEYTKDLCIRRERKEVLPELPKVNRTKLNVVMSPDEEREYDQAVDDFVKWYEEQAENASGSAIIAQMARMRRLVGLAKIPATEEYVADFIEDIDRKLCIFAEHIDVQAILFDDLKRKHGKDIPVLSLFAEHNSYERNEVCNEFNRLPRAILVGSQKAGGFGLNLQTCCDVIMHERQWNPGNEEQCEGRFIRIGSTATSVNAIYTNLEGLTTTDPQLDAIVERKRRQYHAVMNKGEAIRWSEDSIMKELAEVIVRAHRQKKGRAA